MFLLVLNLQLIKCNTLKNQELHNVHFFTFPRNQFHFLHVENQ